MKVVLQTGPVIEPITLAQAKDHLYLDSETFEGNLTISQSMAYASHAIAADYTTHVGTGVDVLGSKAVVLLNSGTNGATGTVDTKIQESDDNITFTDWTGGAFVQVTTANDNANQQKEYTGTKQYIRTVSKVLLAACEFGTSIVVDDSQTSQDDLVTELIAASRRQVENVTRRAMLTQTWDFYLDKFPSGKYIKIPFGNLQSVTHIKYTDADGDETTMTVATDYIVETNGEECGKIVLPYGVSWPSFTEYTSNPIVIRFICGWTTAALVPSPIKSAVKMILADLWENREAQILGQPGQSYSPNMTVDRLLASYKLWDEFK